MDVRIEGHTGQAKLNPPVVDYVEATKNGKTVTIDWKSSSFGTDSAGNYDFNGNDAIIYEESETQCLPLLTGAKFFVCVRMPDTELFDNSFQIKTLLFTEGNESYRVPLDAIKIGAE